MTTTIQIDDEVKKILFRLKLKLEEQKGHSVSYNEIIKFLIKNQKINLLNRKNLKDFRKFEGILPKNALKEYLVEKKRELKREEERISL